ncbi:hypothetical protein [Vulcanisaeta distributa]|uniref:hypothetical protein n=1 Tax=Vulcanisaeta distributa TaxID=164451 RepID=UPI0006D0D4DD|nr:hypothetical protein [Vulcanisaeta distributa]
MERAIQVIPVKIRIWKRGKQFIAVIKDEVAAEELSKYTNQKIKLMIIHGGVLIPIDAKPIMERQGNRTYVLFTLPRRLNALWQLINEAKAKVVIEPQGGVS